MSSISNKEKKLETVGKILIILSSITTPISICLYIISINKGRLINENFAKALPELIGLQIFIFILGIFFFVPNRQNNKKKYLAMGLLLTGYIVELSAVMLLLYGKDSSFKNWLINNVMDTLNYQHVATMLYSDKEITEVLDKYPNLKNIYEEILTFDEIDYNKKTYANKYEEEILTRDNENQIYKIIKINGTTKAGKYEGYMAIIYDPSKVKVATSRGAGLHEGSYGETIDTIAKVNNALVAINAGGWYDPEWNSNGGLPHGLIISDGIIKSDFKRAVEVGGIIGFDKQNRLVLKRMTMEETIQAEIRDCVDFGPFLILNGKNLYEGVTNGGWSIAPRTAIGQRKDGIVLLLVIDGRQSHSIGMDVNDLANIMHKYGAYNAANLDGGTSSAMYVNGQIINTPHNGYKRTVRWLPNIFMVTE